MLRWVLTFFAIALIAALLGFGGVASLSAEMGRMLLTVFVVLVILGLVFGRSYL